jgi:DNA-binding NarL/FixJ family response regulator
VHVRNIMKKLKARNRTEAAFKTDTLLREKHL